MLCLLCRTTENTGRGVFAKKHVIQGELIEKAPVIIFPLEQIKLIDQTVLYNYYFYSTQRNKSFIFSRSMELSFNS